MSRLKICDLSFCDSEVSSNSQVKGGLEFTLYFPKTKLLTTVKNPDADYTTKYFGDEKTGNYGYVVSDKLGKFLAGAAFGTLDNGVRFTTSFAMNANLVQGSST
ncbi:MAG: hypothetical protein KME57_28540 [Scytonema hyalinum WJT4-NPBG1]|jgi:hypothetical protein|nr:hypothetical protein [Scytonema hyalinum WJT4-NPBG1]